MQGDASLDEELDAAAEWSREHKCGQRMAYDLWRFKDEAEITAFLLKWS